MSSGVSVYAGKFSLLSPCVRVHAASTSSSDWRSRRVNLFEFRGFLWPLTCHVTCCGHCTYRKMYWMPTIPETTFRFLVDRTIFEPMSDTSKSSDVATELDYVWNIMLKITFLKHTKTTKWSRTCKKKKWSRCCLQKVKTRCWHWRYM